MYRIRIESCANADESYTFDADTLADVITTCVTEVSNAKGWLDISEMATLLDTIVESMRRYDAGDPPIAREWDFSSPDDAYYIMFFEDSDDDDGTQCRTVWERTSMIQFVLGSNLGRKRAQDKVCQYCGGQCTDDDGCDAHISDGESAAPTETL